jgi:ribonuclease HI
MRQNNSYSCDCCVEQTRPVPPLIHHQTDNDATQHVAKGPSKSSLTIIQWNCDGIWAKREELACWLANHRPDIVLLQETKLNASDHTPAFTNYNAVRLDRQHGRNAQSDRRGGGLVTLIRKGIPYQQAHTLSSSALEALTVAIYNETDALQLTNVYAPPIRNTAEDQRAPDLNLHLLPLGEKSFIGGDFNAHNGLWDTNAAPDLRGQLVESWMDNNGLMAINDGSPTRYSRTSQHSSAPDISLVDSTQAHLFQWSTVEALGSDHIPVRIRWHRNCPNGKPRFEKKFSYKKAEWELFTHAVEQLMAHVDPQEPSIKKLYEAWCGYVWMPACSHIPMKKTRSVYIVWMNDNIKRAIAERNRIRATSANRNEWKQADDHLKDLIKETKARIWRSKLTQIEASRDPKRTWRLIRGLRGDRDTESDKALLYNGRCCVTHKAKANAFIQEYATISQPLSDKEHRSVKVAVTKQLNRLQHSPLHECETPFSRAELQAAIDETPTGKAAGPDDISVEMLQHLPENALEILLALCNRCWAAGDCPQQWREAVIVPILKSGKDPATVGNYRPISLTSCVGKVMERMIKSRLQWWLEHQHKLSPFQAGFRRNRDTTDQCLRLSQSISDAFHAKPPRRTILTQFDYSRAFDTVWREQLLSKMITMGIPARFISYIKGWLVNRRARVKIQGTLSKARVFRAGLPQGSVLSPLLFLIYINDALNSFKADSLVCAFADDVAVSRSGTNKLLTQAEMQQEIDVLVAWSNANRLALNVNKCTTSFFSTAVNECEWQPMLQISGNPVPFEPTPVFLGVKYDRLLHFGPHVDMVVSKASQRNNILRSLGGTDWGWQRKCLRAIYIALQRSVLEYAGPAWAPWASKSHMDRLERCQLAAAKLVTRLTATTPSEAVLHEASLLPIRTRLSRTATKRCIKWELLEQHDCRSILLRTHQPLRLKRVDWRSQHTHKAEQAIPRDSEQIIPADEPPWKRHAHINVIFSDTDKNQTMQDQQQAAERAMAVATDSEYVIYTDGSAAGEENHGGAAVVVYRDGQKCASWSRYTGVHNSSFDVERVAIEEALRWLEPRRWSRATIATDSKSLLTMLHNTKSSNVAGAKILAMISAMHSKEQQVRLVWIPGHCGVQGNEEADTEAAFGREMQHNPIDPGWTSVGVGQKVTAIQAGDFNISHERLKNIYVRRLNNTEDTLSKAERTDLSRFRTGHHPLLRSYQFRIGIAATDMCRLCGEQVETSEHLWLECPALNTQRHRHETGHHLQELITEPGRAAQLVRAILDRLR